MENEYYNISSNIFAAVDPPPPPSPERHPATCGSNNNPGVRTAIGCIRFSDSITVSSRFIQIGAGIAGGIALLMIAYAAFQIMTSSGEPEKIGKAKEFLTAAVSGILFITLSTLIMRVLGVDILGLF